MIEIAIILIIVILLIYIFCKNKPKKKHNRVEIRYGDLIGHQNDNITDILISNLDNKEDKTINDRYDLFRLNLYNRGNLEEARRNLDDILDRLTTIEHVPAFINTEEDIVFHIFNDVNQIIAPYRLPDTILDDNAHNKRENIDHTHQTERREISNIYFNDTQIHDDPQNVHESEINRFYRDKFKLIRKKNKAESNTTTLDTLSMHILNLEDAEKKYRAQKTYQSMMGDGIISSLDSSEKSVLSEVWKRINSEENKEKKSDMVTSLIDQMADATAKSLDNKYHVVCTSGKCLRVLDSLTLLDSDKIIAEPPKTKEIVRKEIFETASKYLENYLDKNEEMSILYNKPEIELTDSENKKVAEFVNDIKDEFSKKIHEDYKNSGISKEVIDTVLVEANVGF